MELNTTTNTTNTPTIPIKKPARKRVVKPKVIKSTVEQLKTEKTTVENVACRSIDDINQIEAELKEGEKETTITKVKKQQPRAKKHVAETELKAVETIVKVRDLIGDVNNIIIDDFTDVKRSIKFTPFLLSVCVLKAKLLFISFEERAVIHQLNELTLNNPKVSCVSCDGICYKKQLSPASTKEKSKRGRKPSEKTIKKRERKDNGEQFRSQITMKIIYVNQKNTDPNYKYDEYTCKVFRNGQVIIPGIKQNRGADGMFFTLDTIASVFSELLAREINGIKIIRDIKWELCDISMQYYKLKLEDKIIKIKLDIMELIIKKIIEHNNKDFIRQVSIADYDEVSSYTYEDITKSIAGVSFLPKKHGITIGLAYKGTKQNKRKYETNIKIYQTGSVNVIGSQQKYRIELVYDWLNWFINKYANIILIKSRCKTCNYQDCEVCKQKKLCINCQMCVSCRKTYLKFD